MKLEEQQHVQGTSRQDEEKHLKETLDVIHDNVESYGRQVQQMREDIDEMLDHFHDDNPELINLLENTFTLHDHMKRALERNERAQKKPYFGRIIFQDETLDREESLYIGKGGISKDSTTQTVIDWRAPVANAYYENGLGKCSYLSPDGKELPIDLQLKRTFDIENGRLLDYFDTEVVANDDLLMKYLSKNKEAVLGEIVATIQKEQNEIIRKTPYHNVIVQGVAGSGKTTVAMHRISFILYNYKDRFRPEDFYIVGSNRILLNYITGVLPDLDVYGVRQMTMEQLFVRLIYEDWDEKKYNIKSVSGSRDTVKGTEGWYLDLIAFIRKLERESISMQPVYLNPRQFVEGLQEGRNGVYDRRGEDEAAGRPARLVELVSGEAVERYVKQNPSISIQSKINMLNERLLTKIKDEFLGKGVKYTEEERKAILKAYRGYYGDKVWKKSIFALYREFLTGQREKGYDITLPTDAFDVYDLAALALLYKLVKETEVISEAHHIVIDEAQDFGMMAYHALFDCIKDCTYTIMGDVSQNIHFGYGLGDWEELRRLILSDPMDSFGLLKKSYRNTVEISDFATNILRHGNFSIYPVEPIIRHGSQVMQKKITGSQTDFARAAADICRSWQQNGYDTIAVVCRNEEEAGKAAEELSKHIAIMESDLEKANFGTGILVLPVEYTKGLEFDAVLIWNPTREDYPVDDGHARLLYVAATRALHELCILYRENLTGLIADPIFKETLALHEKQEQTGNQKASTSGKGRIASAKEIPITPGRKLPTDALKEATETAPVEGASRLPARPKPRINASTQGKTIVVRTEAKAASQTPPGQRLATNYGGYASSPVTLHKAPVEEPARSVSGPQFGDMPATEKLRPAGHAKPNLSVRWVSRQEDGLYLQSQYGILRISPVGSAIVRVTFARGNKIIAGTHPLIATDHVEKNWKYRDNGKIVEVATGEMLLRVEKQFGSIQYLDAAGKLLLSERKAESRQLDGNRNWLYLDFQKGEQLYARGQNNQSAVKLRGSARYISDGTGETLPFLLSDKCYGILPAASGICICCDVPAYGSYLYTETEQQDFYFIAGRQQQTILNAASYLLGLL